MYLLGLRGWCDSWRRQNVLLGTAGWGWWRGPWGRSKLPELLIRRVAAWKPGIFSFSISFLTDTSDTQLSICHGAVVYVCVWWEEGQSSTETL